MFFFLILVIFAIFSHDCISSAGVSRVNVVSYADSSDVLQKNSV